MLKRILKRWKHYKYRFVPWIATNISDSTPRVVSVDEEKLLCDTEVESHLLTLCHTFHSRKMSGCSLRKRHEENTAALQKLWGFSLERRPSQLQEGGQGVFVARGKVQPGTLVAIYPGLVYQPWEPVLLISLANSFLFRCVDGLYIDGKDSGLSKMMYNSCSKRDKVCGQYMCDTTWLTETPVNPLAIGQYVNNQSKEFQANVAYQEFDVPSSFPSYFRQLIPNTEARLQENMEHTQYDRLLRMVVLVSLREISAGEELFSTYYTILHNKREPP